MSTIPTPWNTTAHASAFASGRLNHRWPSSSSSCSVQTILTYSMKKTKQFHCPSLNFISTDWTIHPLGFKQLCYWWYHWLMYRAGILQRAPSCVSDLSPCLFRQERCSPSGSLEAFSLWCFMSSFNHLHRSPTRPSPSPFIWSQHRTLGTGQ